MILLTVDEVIKLVRGFEKVAIVIESTDRMYEDVLDINLIAYENGIDLDVMYATDTCSDGDYNNTLNSFKVIVSTLTSTINEYREDFDDLPFFEVRVE